MRAADWDLKYAITPEKYIAVENRPRKLFSRIPPYAQGEVHFSPFLDDQFRYSFFANCKHGVAPTFGKNIANCKTKIPRNDCGSRLWR